MAKGWELTPSGKNGEQGKTIDSNGQYTSNTCFIEAEKEEDVLAEGERRAKKYLENGYPVPPGNRFFILSPNRERLLLFYL